MTQDYYVFTPYEVYTQDQLTKEKIAELSNRGAKCMAVVFNCKDNEDFKRKYFSNEPCKL